MVEVRWRRAHGLASPTSRGRHAARRATVGRAGRVRQASGERAAGPDRAPRAGVPAACPAADLAPVARIARPDDRPRPGRPVAPDLDRADPSRDRARAHRPNRAAREPRLHVPGGRARRQRRSRRRSPRRRAPGRCGSSASTGPPVRRQGRRHGAATSPRPPRPGHSPRPARQAAVLGEEDLELRLPVVRAVRRGERPLARRPRRSSSGASRIERMAAAIAAGDGRVARGRRSRSRGRSRPCPAGPTRRPGRRPPSPRTACSASSGGGSASSAGSASRRHRPSRPSRGARPGGTAGRHAQASGEPAVRGPGLELRLRASRSPSGRARCSSGATAIASMSCSIPRSREKPPW